MRLIPRFAAIIAFAVPQPHAAQQADRPLSAFQRQKAETLLNEQLSCLGCHELNGDGARSAPSLTGIGTRRSAADIRAIVSDPQRARPGIPMPRARWAPPVQELIVQYLSGGATGPDGVQSVPAVPSAAVAAATRAATPAAARAPSAAPNGAALYQHWCASCHGAGGKGDGVNAKYLPVAPANHADAAAMAKRSDDALYDVIAVGGGPYGRSARMPAFGSTLSAAEIRLLVGQIRALCRCDGPAWSRLGRAP